VFVVSNSLRLRRFRGAPDMTAAPSLRQRRDEVAVVST
jgi:P-type Cu+ transporter